MNLLKEVLEKEVYPAFGCTEPVSCAYAAATAAAELGEPVERLELKVDPGTYKNGAAVVVPQSGGSKGNLIAAAMGAVLAKPESKLLLLQEVTEELLKRSQALVEGGKCSLECDHGREDFHVDIFVAGSKHNARCVLSGGHTNIERIEKDGKMRFRRDGIGVAARADWPIARRCSSCRWPKSSLWPTIGTPKTAFTFAAGSR